MTTLHDISMISIIVIGGSVIFLIILAVIMLIIANIIRRIPFKRKPQNAIVRWFWDMEK